MKNKEKRIKFDGRFLQSLINKVDADAEAGGRSRSNMVECIIKEHYEKKDKKEKK